MSSIGSQSVTIRTNASERTRRIVTPERALVADFQTLVHIFANLIYSRSESFVTGTLETTVNIRARSIATDILLGQAFVIINATPATCI